MEKVQESIILAAISEGFITDDTVAIDATHFEARDKAPAQEKKSTAEPKKRGRKKKEEREQWVAEQAERKANLPLYEKKIEDQLDVPLSQLRAEIPQDPKWGIGRLLPTINATNPSQSDLTNISHQLVSGIRQLRY